MNKNIKAALLTILTLGGIIGIIRLGWLFPDAAFYFFITVAVLAVVVGCFISIKDKL